jgi:excisionase family DNA binding protein
MAATSLLLSIADACELLGISERTGRRLIRSGDFPVSVRKLGCTLKVSRSELEAWAATPAADDIREMAS